MRVIAAGEQEVIVALTRNEWHGITGHSIGDIYGNGGTALSKMAGKQFDLEALTDCIYRMKIAHEVKEKVARNLHELADSVRRAYWPIAEFSPEKAVEVKAVRP